LPLHAIRAFEAAARLGSFKAAAAELFVTPAAISHQVKRLESALGVSLFDRLHRSLQLTHAGEQLSETARVSFQNLETILARLSADGRLSTPKILSVSAASSIATKWLAPRLRSFNARHPDIEIKLSADDRRVDLVRERGTDVGLRYGAGPYDEELEAIPLWPHGRVIMVCSPAITASGKLCAPKDVAQFTLLRTLQPTLPDPPPGQTPQRIDWSAWLKSAGIEAEIPPGPLFGSTQLTLEAAKAGEGLALAPEILVRDDVDAGRLVNAFDISLPNPFRFWLLFRRNRAEEFGIRAFRKWVMGEAAKSDC
jgi:DNA-binding transcriptional LysR family regulator